MRQHQLLVGTVTLALALLAVACTPRTSHRPGTARTNTSPANPTSTATPVERSSALARQGLLVPATYQQACAHEGSVCLATAAGSIPAALKRPLHFPVLRPGQRCPATPGNRVKNASFEGVALGHGPVRPLIGMRGDLRHGITNLAKASPWLAFKTDWFSMPAYRGPFVVRAKRLGQPGQIALGESPRVAPLVMPPGPAVNGTGGWRDAPGYTWVRAPGCYAWQVDGLTFSEIIVVRAVRPALG